MMFPRHPIRLASEFKATGLSWEPAVGNYVYDATGAVQPTSPFQDRVYFLLNYDCFMRKVGGVDRFKEIMTWLPTWNDARRILQLLGVSHEEVADELIRTNAIANDMELLVLYEDVDDGLGVVDEVVGVEFEFLELCVFADEVFDSGRTSSPNDVGKSVAHGGGSEGREPCRGFRV